MTPFSVIAIVSAYNEADIIEQVVVDLIQQDVAVYFIDDGSTDATRDIVSAYQGRGVIAVEPTDRRAEGSGQGEFDWQGILKRKAQLASQLEADWFIHADADEFRESPWQGVGLARAIQRVDSLGYNAIDFVSLDFWPVHDEFRPGDDVRSSLPFYSRAASYDRVQVRCWKKQSQPVDLASSGGHDALFPGRSVFPVRFLLRHYPIRSQAHGQRKVFEERRARFSAHERALGWHVQYDRFDSATCFVREPETLTRFDPEAVRIDLSLRHREVERLEEDLRRLASEHDAARTQLASQTGTSQSLQAETEALRQSVELQARRLDDATSQLEARTQQLSETARQLADATRQLEDATQQLRSSRQHLSDREREVARLDGAVAAAHGRLDALYQSKTWRWTQLLRTAIDFLARLQPARPPGSRDE